MDTSLDGFEPTLQDLRDYYYRYFSLGCLNTTTGNKFILISLICFLTNKVRAKTPTATCEQVIRKIAGDGINSPGLLRALSIICEDYMTDGAEFPTFKLKTSAEMVEKIKEVLHTEIPFKNQYPVRDLPF